MISNTQLKYKKYEAMLGTILRLGVFTSALFVMVGGIFYLMHNGFNLPHYKVFKGEPAALRSIGSIFRGLTDWKSAGVIQFGLLILMFTPVLRVFFALILFLKERDLTYVVVALIVFSTLIFSIFWV